MRRRNRTTRAFLGFIILLFTGGCSSIKTPVSLLKSRYENVKEKRDIEIVFKSDYNVVAVATMGDGKCKQIETSYLSNLNDKREWKIVRTHNKHICKDDIEREKLIQNKYKKWLNTNSLNRN